MAKVHTERLGRVLEGMGQEGFSQLLLCSPASLRYLIGAAPMAGERLQALYVNEEGTVILLTPELNAISLGPVEGAELMAAADGEDGVGMLVPRLIRGRIGVDGAWPSRFLLSLLRRVPDREIGVGSPCVERARMIKDREEQALLRESSRRNDAVMAELVGSIRGDLTEAELSYLGDGLFVRHGRIGPGLPPMVCYGKNCADPHHLTMGDDRLTQGDFVLFDMGMAYRGYHSDMTRTVAFGTPGALQEEIYRIVLEANLRAIDAVRPGVRACDIDAAAREVIREAGYGECFPHRTGHGIGLEGHEYPDIGARCDEVIRPGMCFSVEPGIYLPGVTGVRIEDLVLVTETGCEVLNHYEKERIVRVG